MYIKRNEYNSITMTKLYSQLDRINEMYKKNIKKNTKYLIKMCIELKIRRRIRPAAKIQRTNR